MDLVTQASQLNVNRAVVVKVPASTANLGPGFDSLGMALSLFAWVRMSAAQKTTIRLYGDQLTGITTDKSNLVYTVAQQVFQRVGLDIPELDISIRSEIPLTRGLGSSASAIIGALVAANALVGNPLDQDELFQMATEIEKHPDNVGASLYGAIIAAAWDGTRVEYVRLEPPAGLELLVAIPTFELSTKKARNVLPETLSMADAVFNVSHSSLLTAALATGRLDLLRHAMRDRLHQPYRAALVPGMETILRDAGDHGALGAVLSGAGPTLLLPVSTAEKQQERLESYVTGVMQAEGIDVELKWLKPWLLGPEVLTVEDEKYACEYDPLLLMERAASDLEVNV